MSSTNPLRPTGDRRNSFTVVSRLGRRTRAAMIAAAATPAADDLPVGPTVPAVAILILSFGLVPGDGLAAVGPLAILVAVAVGIGMVEPGCFALVATTGRRL